ncbi:MAG: hypothetical protein KDC14_17600, partial [Planctomycetes bacterium]|nr:hypothetical protein [Planctomycetota bacterium]
RSRRSSLFPYSGFTGVSSVRFAPRRSRRGDLNASASVRAEYRGPKERKKSTAVPARDGSGAMTADSNRERE